MPELHFDSPLSDAERRARLYAGAVFVYRPARAALDLCAFAGSLIREAFDGLDPETAQYEMPVERYAEILKALKPRFIHHPESQRLVREILAERGCDPDDTHFDVPRMRSSTSDGYLTSGIAYAWHPHRDTWYSAPPCQQNWWTPVYPVTAGNCMELFLDCFDRDIPNTSAQYDYAEWNSKHRFNAAEHLRADPRPLPGPLAPLEARGTPLVVEVGSLIVFSGAQLHASVANRSGRTRFSLDFRTLSLADAAARRGAPCSDARCTNSSIRDFRRARDLAAVPGDLALAYEAGRGA